MSPAARVVAFLRAINVGGHVVPMARLAELFRGLGLAEVETFIASGNVIFSTVVCLRSVVGWPSAFSSLAPVTLLWLKLTWTRQYNSRSWRWKSSASLASAATRLRASAPGSPARKPM